MYQAFSISFSFMLPPALSYTGHCIAAVPELAVLYPCGDVVRYDVRAGCYGSATSVFTLHSHVQGGLRVPKGAA
jgi:hypothetical protein